MKPKKYEKYIYVRSSKQPIELQKLYPLFFYILLDIIIIIIMFFFFEKLSFAESCSNTHWSSSEMSKYLFHIVSLVFFDNFVFLLDFFWIPYSIANIGNKFVSIIVILAFRFKSPLSRHLISEERFVMLTNANAIVFKSPAVYRWNMQNK